MNTLQVMNAHSLIKDVIIEMLEEIHEATAEDVMFYCDKFHVVAYTDDGQECLELTITPTEVDDFIAKRQKD